LLAATYFRNDSLALRDQAYKPFVNSGQFFSKIIKTH